MHEPQVKAAAMARVSLRSILNLTTTASQGSEEGKRFSWLDFFPSSEDTTRAISIVSLQFRPYSQKPTKHDEVFNETGNHEDGQHETEKPWTSFKITKSETLKTIWKE